jgi:hypothetical protein
LTQRKFLRLASGFAESMMSRPFPRLFALDFMDVKETSAQEATRLELASVLSEGRIDKSNGERNIEIERQRHESEHRNEEEDTGRVATNNKSARGHVKEKKKILCIRTLCEHEESWHSAGHPFEITDRLLVQNSSPYLSRVMLVLKQSDITLDIFISDEGEVELKKLDEASIDTCMMIVIETVRFSFSSLPIRWLRQQTYKQKNAMPICGDSSWIVIQKRNIVASKSV